MSVIEDVKQRSDIVEVIGQYTTLKKAGRTYRGLCPFHSEKTPSFFVYPEQQSWHCFGACATGGDVFAFVMKKQTVSFGEALQLLAGRSGIPVPVFNERPGEKKEKDRLFEANLAAVHYYHELFLNAGSAEKARKYLAKRGLNLKTIMQFQFGYAPNDWEALRQHLNYQGFTDKELITAGLIMETEEKRIHDRFRNKLMIPIYDVKSNVCGFGARILDESELKSGPKYINSPQTPVFDKSGTLYGINFAADSIRKHDRVIIVEGYMDVVVAHQYGFTNVVASMGTAINEKQINIIKRLTRNVSLALDPDAAGEKAMLQGVNYENLLDAEVKVMLLPEGKDPDEVIKENKSAWPQLIDAGIPVIDYIITTNSMGLDIQDVKDKTTLINKLTPIIGEIKNEVRRGHYIIKLAQLTGLKPESLRIHINKTTPHIKQGIIKRVVSKFKPGENVLPAEAVSELTFSLVTNPLEEFILALLLQNQNVKDWTGPLEPECFENTINREIYVAWQKSSDLDSIKWLLDSSILEHFELLKTRLLNRTPNSDWTQDQWDKFESLIGMKITHSKALEICYECSLRLKSQYLKNRQKEYSQALDSAKKSGGTDSELEEFIKQGLDLSSKMKETDNLIKTIRKGK